jgi:hypothetical protein
MDAVVRKEPSLALDAALVQRCLDVYLASAMPGAE